MDINADHTLSQTPCQLFIVDLTNNGLGYCAFFHDVGSLAHVRFASFFYDRCLQGRQPSSEIAKIWPDSLARMNPFPSASRFCTWSG